jgi:hypothetical protein
MQLMHAMQINQGVPMNEQDHTDGVQLLRELADTMESERGIVGLMARCCLLALEAGVIPAGLKLGLVQVLKDGGWIGDGAGRDPVDAVLRHDLGGES